MKIKLTIIVISLMSSITVLGAQTFNPMYGTTYPIEIFEWIINGEDKFPVMKSNLRTCTIVFNSDNTIVKSSNALHNTTYTFFSNGSFEFSVRALFIRQSGSGTGRIERTGRDFTIFLSITENESEYMSAVIRGSIK